MLSRLVIAAAVLAAAPATAAIGVKQIGSGLSQPVFVTGRGGDDLYVVQQGGTIARLNRVTGATSTFFTVPDIETGGEKGLLGFTFDPTYNSTGRFYVDVTTRINGQLYTEVRRYTNPAIKTEASQLIIRVAQPFDNHNGGWIEIGPDKKLYIALGDGGSANDPNNNAQNLGSNLGKILRLDVTKDAFPADATRNYAIPADNPYHTEIFAYGLRNPYRDSFDSTTGDLWIGDVGQGAREEVDHIVKGTSGQNFGWRPLEGTIPTPGIGDAIPAGTTPPVFEYDHGTGQSITGGVVFRGAQVGDLLGKYVFGDFVAGKLFSLGLDGTGFTDITSALGGLGGFNPSSFGTDANRNLYVVDYSGRIFRFVTTSGNAPALSALVAPSVAAVPEPATWTLLIAGFAMIGAAARRRALKA